MSFCHLNLKTNQLFILCFLDQPEILNKSTTIVNETDYVVLSREIISNPQANVSWYDRAQLLDTQIAARNATFIINRAMCTDTKNFTLVASNTVQENVSALVELIVNCEYKYYCQVSQNKAKKYVSNLKVVFTQTVLTIGASIITICLKELTC